MRQITKKIVHLCSSIVGSFSKWDAYLECLEDLELDKSTFSVDDEVGQHFSLDDA